jgi:hypothetical protein
MDRRLQNEEECELSACRNNVRITEDVNPGAVAVALCSDSEKGLVGSTLPAKESENALSRKSVKVRRVAAARNVDSIPS